MDDRARNVENMKKKDLLDILRFMFSFHSVSLKKIIQISQFNMDLLRQALFLF